MNVLALLCGLAALVLLGIEAVRTRSLGWAGLVAFVAMVMAQWLIEVGDPNDLIKF